MNIINFRLPNDLRGFIAEPYPAATRLPKWYKDLQLDVPTGPDQFPVGTARRCSPMLDSFSAGYIIPHPVDVYVVTDDDNNTHFTWRTGDKFVAVGGHGEAQYGSAQITGAHKWMNPWSVKTPPGYSCLFITPVNRPELPFECFTGIVDTDTYNNQVNLPFHWTEYPFEGYIKQGDPMIQVIPFKREDWGYEIEVLDDEASLDLENEGYKVHAQAHHYKREHHNKKKWYGSYE